MELDLGKAHPIFNVYLSTNKLNVNKKIS
jgi:hypothetical protein